MSLVGEFCMSGVERKFVSILIGITFLMSSLQVAQAEADGWDVFQEAIKLRNSKRYDKAVELLKTIPSKFPRDRHLGANAERQVADVYMKMKRYADAEKQYRRVAKEYIDQKSVAVMAAHSIPNCLRYQKRLEEAVAAAREFRKTFSAHRPRMAYSLWMEVSSLLKLKRYREAEQVLDRLAEEYPEQEKVVASALVEFSDRMRKRGVRSKQEKAIDKMIEALPDALNKNVQKAYAEKAHLLKGKGQETQAESYAGKSLAIAVLRGASSMELVKAQEVVVRTLGRTGNMDDLRVASIVLFNLSPVLNKSSLQYPLESLLKSSQASPDQEGHYRQFIQFHLNAIKSSQKAKGGSHKVPALVLNTYSADSRIALALKAAAERASARQQGLLALLQNNPKGAAALLYKAFNHGEYANASHAAADLGICIDALRGGRTGSQTAARLYLYGFDGPDREQGTDDDLPKWLAKLVRATKDR